MDGYQINQKVRYGYAKASYKLGINYDLYRTNNSAIDPLDPANLVGQILMQPVLEVTVAGWLQANKPGNSLWKLVVDGQDSTYPLSVVVKDFLVGPDIFYVISKQNQLPVQGIECNKIVDIIRPYQYSDPGGGGYAGYLPSTSAILMQNVPCSFLINGKGYRSPSKLPTDTIQPTWIVMIANLNQVNLRTGDIVVSKGEASLFNSGNDPVIENYVIIANEETEFGWRLTVSQVLN